MPAVLYSHDLLNRSFSPRYLHTCHRCTQHSQSVHRTHSRNLTDNIIQSQISPTCQWHTAFPNALLPKLCYAPKSHLPPSICRNASYPIIAANISSQYTMLVFTGSRFFFLPASCPSRHPPLQPGREDSTYSRLDEKASRKTTVVARSGCHTYGSLNILSSPRYRRKRPVQNRLT